MDQFMSFLGGVLFAGFVYFLYLKVSESRARKRGAGGGAPKRPVKKK